MAIDSSNQMPDKENTQISYQLLIQDLSWCWNLGAQSIVMVPVRVECMMKGNVHLTVSPLNPGGHWAVITQVPKCIIRTATVVA